MKPRLSFGVVRTCLLTGAALTLAVPALITASEASQGAAPLDEYQVKAAFVYNFTRFVEWPGSAFGSPVEAFPICVLGRNPFGKALEGMAGGANVDGHPIAIRQLAESAEAPSCRILFVSASERLRYRAILSGLKGSPVFTVGDTEDFLTEGGIAGLRLENGRVRIELNPQAAKQNGLRISSRLMSLAQSAR